MTQVEITDADREIAELWGINQLGISGLAEDIARHRQAADRAGYERGVRDAKLCLPDEIELYRAIRSSPGKSYSGIAQHIVSTFWPTTGGEDAGSHRGLEVEPIRRRDRETPAPANVRRDSSGGRSFGD